MNIFHCRSASGKSFVILAAAQRSRQRENSLFCSFFIEKTENGVKLHGLLFGEEVM